MFLNNLFNDFSPFSSYSNYPYRNRPRPETSYRNDNRPIIINKLINDQYNYMCFDCKRQTNGLNYFDVKNAVFLCYNCALQHNSLPKEICEVLSGDIRTLDERYLLLFYYGGNRNLIEFIRGYYPLLDRMSKNTMYATKAMDYYRHLLMAKAYNQKEPYMPKKLEGYNSIFQTKNNFSPSRINPNQNNENSRNNEQRMETEEPNNYLYNSCRFNKKKKTDEDEDVEMKDDSSKKSEDSTYDDAEGIMSDKENKEYKENTNDYNKCERNKNDNKKKETKNKNDKNIIKKSLTINQLGELSMYPDAKAIDDMD